MLQRKLKNLIHVTINPFSLNLNRPQSKLNIKQPRQYSTDKTQLHELLFYVFSNNLLTASFRKLKWLLLMGVVFSQRHRENGVINIPRGGKIGPDSTRQRATKERNKYRPDLLDQQRKRLY